MAAETGNEMLLHSLVNYGSNLETKSADGKTALHIATTKGNQQCLLILLNAGANIDALDSRGDTALHYAAYAGRFELLKLFAERKADLSKRNHDLDNAFHICAKEGHILAAKFLLQIGFEVDSITSGKQTALHLAISQHGADMVEFLLDNGADINAKDCLNITPLFLAVAGGHQNLAQVLLERGAELHSISFGMFPLRRAMLNNREDMMELLLHHGATVSEASSLVTCRKGIHDRALLFRAVELKRGFFLHLLLQQGADPNTISMRFGSHLLNYAILKGQVASTRLLLEYGAQTNFNTWGPLRTAMSSHHSTLATNEMKNSALAIIKLLLVYGANTRNLSRDDMEFFKRCSNSKFPRPSAL